MSTILNVSEQRIISDFIVAIRKYNLKKGFRADPFVSDHTRLVLDFLNLARIPVDHFRLIAKQAIHYSGRWKDGKGVNCNPNSDLHVWNQESGNTNWLATKFLDEAAGCVMQNDAEQAHANLVAEFEGRKSEECKIRLTEIGDILDIQPRPPIVFTEQQFGNWPKGISLQLPEYEFSAGLHRLCRGSVCREARSESHDQLRCSRCNMAVLFPRRLETYKDLKMWLNLPEQDSGQ